MTDKKSNDEQQEWLSGITIFLIRECELAYLDILLKLLDHYGFNVLCSVPIEGGQQQALAQWVLDDGPEQGNFTSSGSPPVFLLVVQDVHPVPAKRMSSDSSGQVKNLRLPTIKAAFSATISPKENKEEHPSPIHCSHDADQALKYLKALMPEQVSKIRGDLQDIPAWA